MQLTVCFITFIATAIALLGHGSVASGSHSPSPACLSGAATLIKNSTLQSPKSLHALRPGVLVGDISTGRVYVDCTGPGVAPLGLEVRWDHTTAPLLILSPSGDIRSLRLVSATIGATATVTDALGNVSKLRLSRRPIDAQIGPVDAGVRFSFSFADSPTDEDNNTIDVVGGVHGPLFVFWRDYQFWPNGDLVASDFRAPSATFGPIKLGTHVEKLRGVLPAGKIRPYCLGLRKTNCAVSEQYTDGRDTLTVVEDKGKNADGTVGSVVAVELKPGTTSDAPQLPTRFGPLRKWLVNGCHASALLDMSKNGWERLPSSTANMRLTDGFWILESQAKNGLVTSLYLGL
jgi:hypothetical protein